PLPMARAVLSHRSPNRRDGPQSGSGVLCFAATRQTSTLRVRTPEAHGLQAPVGGSESGLCNQMTALALPRGFPSNPCAAKRAPLGLGAPRLFSMQRDGLASSPRALRARHDIG